MPNYTQGFCNQYNLYDSLSSILGLAHLCEFIEDCEHTVLATKILHLLGREGPRTPTPSKYIRFIYNRVILENAAVRAGEFTIFRLSTSTLFFFCLFLLALRFDNATQL